MIEKHRTINSLRTKFGQSASRKDIVDHCESQGMTIPNWLFVDKYKIARGMYNIPYFDQNGVEKLDSVEIDAKLDVVNIGENKLQEKEMEMSHENKVSPENFSGDSLIPAKNPFYTPFGNHAHLKAIVKSRRFFPTFITGLSGNGKTTTVLQVCHDEGRGLLRVNITCETDEDDLLGGFRLVNGNTVFQHGPVVEAMRGGHVLLLDEIDLASTKIMCLQPILEGMPVFLKKTGEIIRPAPGFNIVATANTKGQGSDSGKFIGTGVLNEAFLDRFSCTMEQDYPPESTEKKIIGSILESAGVKEDDLVEKLVKEMDIWMKKLKKEEMVDQILFKKIMY